MFLRQDAGIYFSTLNEFLDLIVNDEVTVVNILKIYFMENHLEKETFIPLEKKSVNAVISSFKRLNKHELGNI